MSYVNLNNKTHRIVKFPHSKSKNEDKRWIENMRRGQEYFNLIMSLCDNFLPITYNEICLKYFGNETYKKPWKIGSLEIALDMLSELDLHKACHWDCDYLAIPISNKELHDFFFKHLPDHAVEITRAGFHIDND